MGNGYSTIARKNRWQQKTESNGNRSNIQSVPLYFSNIRIEGRPPIRRSLQTEQFFLPSNETEKALAEVNSDRAIDETKPALSSIPQKKRIEAGKSNGRH